MDVSINYEKRARIGVFSEFVYANALRSTQLSAFAYLFRNSPFMGSTQLIDDTTDTFLTAYGGGIRRVAFEEYDFSRGQQNMLVVFKDGHDLYALTQGDTGIPR